MNSNCIHSRFAFDWNQLRLPPGDDGRGVRQAERGLRDEGPGDGRHADQEDCLQVPAQVRGGKSFIFGEGISRRCSQSGQVSK